MGRRHLIAAAALAALALVAAAPSGAAVSWRVVADGPSPGRAPTALAGEIALDRAATATFSARLGGGAAAKLSQVDFAENAVVAIFGEFGCADSLITVSSLAQHGSSLSVRLVQKQPPPGSAQCMAVFGTYRLLAVPKATLRRPYPTRVVVTFARA